MILELADNDLGRHEVEQKSDELRISRVVEEVRVHSDGVVLLVDQELTHIDRDVVHLKLHLDLLPRHVDCLQLEEARHSDEDGDDHAKYCGIQTSVGLPLNLIK